VIDTQNKICNDRWKFKLNAPGFFLNKKFCF
jgi:hypothetical protein